MLNIVPASLQSSVQPTYAEMVKRSSNALGIFKVQQTAQQCFGNLCARTNPPDSPPVLNNRVTRLIEERPTALIAGKPNRQKDYDLKMERLGLDLDSQEPFPSFYEQAKKNVGNYQQNLKLLDNYYGYLYQIYDLYEKYKELDPEIFLDIMAFYSESDLEKMMSELDQKLEFLRCSSFESAFEGLNVKFDNLNTRLMEIYQTSKMHYEHLCSLEKRYTEKLGKFFPKKLSNLKAGIFNCQILHHKAIEEKKALITHNVNPKHLDSLLSILGQFAE